MVARFPLWITLLHVINAQVEIWNYPMTSATGLSDWIGGSLNTISGNNACPASSTTSCWRINSASTSSRNIATTGYQNIELSYSIASVASGGNKDQCFIDYSVDDNTFVPIVNTISRTNFVFSSWGDSAKNIASFTIRLRYIGTGHKLNCYFNDLILRGELITSSPTPKPSLSPTISFSFTGTAYDVWYYSMTTSPGSPWQGSSPSLHRYADNYCPNSPPCWRFYGATTYEVSADTFGFSQTHLVYSVATWNVIDSDDSCGIDYSVNGVDFKAIVRLNNQNRDGSYWHRREYVTFGNWNVDNIASLTIRIRNTGSCSCYFNHFRLQGVTVEPTKAPFTPSVPPTRAPSGVSTSPTNYPTQIPSVPSIPPTESPICSTTGHWTQRYYCEYCTDDSYWASGTQQYTTLQTSCITTSYVNKVCLVTGGYGVYALGVGWKNGEDSAMIGGDGSKQCSDLDSFDTSNWDCFDKVRIWHKTAQFTSAVQFGTSAGIWKDKRGTVGDTMVTVTGNSGECILAMEVGTQKERNTQGRYVSHIRLYYGKVDFPTSAPVTAHPSTSVTRPPTVQGRCNGVEYEISGNSYFEAVGACVNQMVYFCDGNVLKQQPCTTTNASVAITDVCAKITTEKNANSCQTYCAGESCPAVIYTEYPLIYKGDCSGVSGQCISDPQVLCSFYWYSSSKTNDISSGAATQTVYATDRCIDSKIYSCIANDAGSYYPYISQYHQADCSGNAASTSRYIRECTVVSSTSTRPRSWSCYPEKGPTSAPTATSNHPTYTPTLTVNPSNQPSSTPSLTANPSTVAPSISAPFISTTVAPSTPTAATDAPSTTTKRGTSSSGAWTLNLDFVLRYTDKSWDNYYHLHLVDSQYAQVLHDAVFASMESISGHSAMYSDADIWKQKAWNRAGIINFDVCRIFSDIELGDDDCALYEANEQDEYVSVASFSATADQAIDDYVEYLREQMTSATFYDIFGAQMNDELDAIINGRRRRNLLNDNNFEVVSILIIDPLLNDLSTTQDEDASDKNEDGFALLLDTVMSVNYMIFIVVGGCAVLVLAICIWCCCCKRRSHKRERIGDDEEQIEIADTAKSGSDDKQKDNALLSNMQNQMNANQTIAVEHDSDDDIVLPQTGDTLR
eukprot:44728_1